MASTQSASAIWSGETFTAGSAHADSAVQTINTGYGAAGLLKITNGATPPTVPLGLQLQSSMDNSEFYDYGGPMIAGVDASESYSFPFHFKIGDAQYWKVINYQTNTVQNVTVDLDGNNVTAVA